MSADDQPQPIRGIAAALVGAAVLTAVASVMPAATRKLVLFAIVFGLGTGWIVAATARQFATPRSLALVLAPLLAVAGLLFVAQRTWREYQTLQRTVDAESSQRNMPSPMLEAITANDPETAAMLRRERSRAAPDFLQYLAVRTSPLGEWPHPWPALFWVGELALASSAGVLIASRMLNRGSGESPTAGPIREEAKSA